MHSIPLGKYITGLRFTEQQEIPAGFSVFNSVHQACDDGDKVVFDTVETNFDDSFNLTDNSFTVQYPGVYLFLHQLHTTEGNNGRTDILLNGRRLASASAHGNAEIEGDSTAVVMAECQQGDVVYVQCRVDGDVLYGGTMRLTSFTVYLLRLS